MDCGAERGRKNHQGKLAMEVAKSPEVKVALKVLTDQGLLSLSNKITSNTDLNKLAIHGLRIPDYMVQKHITNENDISSAAHRVLQDWRTSKESDKVAGNQLWEALGLSVVGLNRFRDTLFE